MIQSGGRNLKIVAGHESGPFLSAVYDVEYCRTGGYTIFLDGVPYEITEGDLYVIFPHVEARRKFVAPITETSYFSLNYGGEILDEIGFSPCAPMFPSKIPPRAAEAFENLLDALDLCGFYVAEEDSVRYGFDKNTRGEDANVAVLRRNAAYFTLTAELMRERKTVKLPTQVRYVEDAIRFLNANFRHEIGVSELSEHIGVNRSYLYKLFREQVGMSIQQYLIRLRMDAACTMLEETDAAVGTVALSVGYEPLHFSKMFKRYYRCSPLEYRKRQLTERRESDILKTTLKQEGAE